MVIPHGHENISGIAPDNNVGGGVKIRQSVEWQVGLDKSAPYLRPEVRDDVGNRPDILIQPGRHHVHRRWKLTVLIEQVGDDGLCPGGSCFVGRRDDDVTLTMLEPVPSIAVDDGVIDVAVRLYRQVSHTSCQTTSCQPPPQSRKL